MSELEAAGHSGRVEEHLLRIAARDGFPFMVPPFLPKTHLALSLGELARDAGPEKHWAMHRALFGAYFGEGRDIGSRDVLLEIAASEGFDAEEVRTAWDEDRYGERLHQFRHVAMHLGIDATPAALICNELLIGSRPYEVLRKSLDRCMVTAANAEEMAAGAD